MMMMPRIQPKPQFPIPFRPEREFDGWPRRVKTPQQSCRWFPNHAFRRFCPPAHQASSQPIEDRIGRCPNSLDDDRCNPTADGVLGINFFAEIEVALDILINFLFFAAGIIATSLSNSYGRFRDLRRAAVRAWHLGWDHVGDGTVMSREERSRHVQSAFEPTRHVVNELHAEGHSRAANTIHTKAAFMFFEAAMEVERLKFAPAPTLQQLKQQGLTPEQYAHDVSNSFRLAAIEYLVPRGKPYIDLVENLSPNWEVIFQVPRFAHFFKGLEAFSRQRFPGNNTRCPHCGKNTHEVV